MCNKRILIALEQMGVGGIETFVLNQIKPLIRNNIDVYVLARKDNYYEKFKEAGAKIIDYSFEDSIYFDNKKIDEICNILKDNKIDEVHINQFPLINVLMPACIMTNTPYIAYLHMASGIIDDPVHNAYNYFETQFITYKKFFNMFFKYASKIIAITESIKKYTADRYGIDKKKIIVRPNTIDCDYFSTNKKVDNIKKVLIISRLSKEKETSLINGIKLYQELKKSDNNISLSIAGDGNYHQELKNYVDTNNIDNVTFMGNVLNVKEVIEKHDLVIALDRCILESLCLERLSVISGYESMKGLVTIENVESCIKDNFCGASEPDKKIEEVAKELMNLNKDDIKRITKDNLRIIKSKLDANKKLLYLDIKKANYNYQEYIKDMNEISEILGKSQIEYYNKAEEIWKAYKDTEKKINKRYGVFEKIINSIKR